MKYLEFAGLRVSAIGLGTWQFGTREWGYGDAYAAETAPAIVRRARELGITLIDSAEFYGFGRSERIVGEALQGLPDGAVLATKLTPALPLPPLVRGAAERSRERLRVDAIDLYQVHWPNPLVPTRLLARSLRSVLDRGIARHVGVSNYSLRRWQRLERALDRPIVSNQVRFSLGSPDPARELLPYAREHGRLLIAYSPLGQGFLADAHPGSERHAGTRGSRVLARRVNPLHRGRAEEAAGPLRAAVREVAGAHGATPAQVALAWLIGLGNVAAIPGARTIAQLEENAAAADLELTADEMERLTEAANRFEAARRS